VHAAAWKDTFDAFLRAEAARTDGQFVPFDAVLDYDTFVDGRPRLDGTRAFLHSRGVDLPEGTDADPPNARTVHGISLATTEPVLRLIGEEGAQPYDGSVAYVRRLSALGLPRAVVSSSANCRDVLRAAGIEELFDVIVDGNVAKREGLPGKPAPDTYLYAAR